MSRLTCSLIVAAFLTMTMFILHSSWTDKVRREETLHEGWESALRGTMVEDCPYSDHGKKAWVEGWVMGRFRMKHDAVGK